MMATFEEMSRKYKILLLRLNANQTLKLEIYKLWVNRLRLNKSVGYQGRLNILFQY